MKGINVIAFITTLPAIVKMDKLTDKTKERFFRLLDKDLPIKDFEKWVYDNNNRLETELQPNLHFDLTALDYHQKDCFQLLQDKITPHIDKDEYNIWRTRRLLTDIIENKIDLVVATHKLRNLYWDTDEKLIPITLGIGYESEIGNHPTPDQYDQWDEKALKEKLKVVEAYRDNIVNDARQLLDDLDKNKKTTAGNKGYSS